jgi:hypothetical protein
MENAMRRKILIPLLLLSLLVSGCQVFPYVYTPTAEAIEEATVEPPSLTDSADDPVLEPIWEAAKPTATLESITAADETITAEGTDANQYYIPFSILVPAPEFTVQQGNPVYLANFAHPAAGCDWSGVAGQVFGESGQMIKGLIVLTGSDLDGEENEWAAQTGLATAYGPGGYEIQIMDKTQATNDTYWVQVVDESGNALSDKIYFDTYLDCEKNLVLINFVPVSNSTAKQEEIKPEATPTPAAYP